MLGEFGNRFSPEELKKALINQGKMLEAGADVTEEGVLVASEEQIKLAKAEMLAERPVLTDRKEQVVELAEAKLKGPEPLIWIPDNYKEQLGEFDIIVFNRLLTENRFPLVYADAVPKIGKVFETETGKPLPRFLGDFLNAYASSGSRYRDFMEEFKREVGPKVYSMRQMPALTKMLEKISDKGMLAIYDEIRELFTAAKTLPDLPLAVIQSVIKEEPLKTERRNPVSSAGSAIEVSPPSILQNEVVIQQDPEAERQREIGFLRFEVEQLLGYSKPVIQWPSELKIKNMLACRLFDAYTTRTYDGYQQAKQSEMPAMKKRFEALGIGQGFSDAQTLADAYWEQYKGNIISQNKELLAKNLESDPEYQKLPAQFKLLIVLFNTEIYPIKKLRLTEKADKLRQLGITSFNLIGADKALSTMNYEFGLKKQENIGDADCFGFLDGSQVYLIPNRGELLIGTNRIAHLKHLNKTHEIGSAGNFRIEKNEKDSSTPIKILKPPILRQTKTVGGDAVYTIDRSGEIIVVPKSELK